MDAALALPLLIALIVVALLFDFLNGLHDAANSIATIVSTRVLRPQYAVFWAAFFNFIAFLCLRRPMSPRPRHRHRRRRHRRRRGDLRRADGRDRLERDHLVARHPVIELARADRRPARAPAWPRRDLGAIVWSGVLKTTAAIVLSPLIGFLLALVLVLIVSWLFVRSTPFAVDRAFRILQFVSASLYSLGHGGNDAQKTMGIIAVLLYSQGYLGGEFHVPFWVVLTCQAAMALGTLIGGWRIVHTMGSRITRLTPMQGFCAETGGAITLFVATWLGIPVSTTHTITGAIVGVGAARRISAVRWSVAQQHRRRLDHHDPGLSDRGCTDMVGRQDLRQVTSSPTKSESRSP